MTPEEQIFRELGIDSNVPCLDSYTGDILALAVRQAERIAALEAGIREIQESAEWASEESKNAKSEGRRLSASWVFKSCSALLSQPQERP